MLVPALDSAMAAAVAVESRRSEPATDINWSMLSDRSLVVFLVDLDRLEEGDGLLEAGAPPMAPSTLARALADSSSDELAFSVRSRLPSLVLASMVSVIVLIGLF